MYSVTLLLRAAQIEDSHVAVLWNVAPRHRHPSFSHSLSLTLTFTSSPYTLYYTLDQRTSQEYSELGALTYIHPSYE
jgi:hypothetical protein